MNKSLASRIVALICLGLFTLQSFAGTVTGQVQNAAAGPVRNGTFSFTLTAPATVAGTATVVTSSVPCYTDGNGNVAGEPDPLLAPVLSVNLASGTLPAAIYFVKIWYFDGTGNSFVSPEASISLVSIGTLNVLSPVKQPLNASGYRIGISTVSGSETIQGSVTGVPGAWGNFSQSVPLTVPAAAAPVSNTTVCTLRFNDELTPSFTCYDVGLTSSTGGNIPGYPAYWYLNGGSAGTINVGSGTPQSNVCQGQGVVYPQAIVTQPPFNATQTINGGLNITGNETVGGALGVTGNVTETTGQNQYKAFSINKLCWVDGIKYTSISSAYTDSANCNAVFVPTLGSACYTETLAADLALNRSSVPITFMGCAVITQGAFRITAPSGTNNISIFSPFQHSSNIAGANLGVSFGGYTGSGNAVDIGDSSGFTNNVKIVGINVGIGQAAAGATCIKLTNVNQFALDDNGCIGNAAAANQVGFKTLGTGAFFTGLGRLLNPDCAMGGASAICMQFGPISNGIVIVGGHGNMGGASSVAIDVPGPTSSGIKSVGYDADVATTALTVESTAQGAFNGDLRIDSGTTNIATFAAGTNGNRLEVINARALTTVTDNGLVGTNSVYSAFDIQFNSRLWRIESAAGAQGFEIVDVSDGSVAFAKGVGGNAQINSSPGNATIINQNTGAGMELRNAGVAVVDWDAIGTFHPAVAGAVGLGTVALPEKNVIVGQSANNSTTWQPTTTAGRTLTSPDGNSSTVMPFNFTTTAAATDNVTVTGMTASGHCTLTPTNTAAAAGIASVFVSAKAANQITVTHTATANWTFDGLCTSN